MYKHVARKLRNDTDGYCIATGVFVHGFVNLVGTGIEHQAGAHRLCIGFA